MIQRFYYWLWLRAPKSAGCFADYASFAAWLSFVKHLRRGNWRQAWRYWRIR